MPLVRADSLAHATGALFAELGVPAAEAAIVADHLVDAELAGVNSHGILRVAQYVEAIERGEIVPSARLSVVKETLATVALDGNHGFGQVMARGAMEMAMAHARRAGIGAATLVHSSHTGRLGSYTEFAAREGLVGMMMVNAGGHGQWVAPFGGSAGRLSTNPLSIAVPTGGAFPLVLDIATSTAPEGKVRAYKVAGKAVPEGWVITSEGRSTTDPADLYGPPRGALLPFGGHKGFGLGLLVDALAGGLSGAGCCVDVHAPMQGRTDGVFVLAINVEAFGTLAYFQAQMEQLIRHVKNCPPAPGHGEIVVPGEPEARERARRLREGIPIEEAVWVMLQSVFARFRVACEQLLVDTP
jgi:uncharacterized oxidoreductase